MLPCSPIATCLLVLTPWLVACSSQDGRAGASTPDAATMSGGGAGGAGAAGSGGAGSGGAAGSAPSPDGPALPAGACSDLALGVCRIADPGVGHVPLSRAGANGLALDPGSGLVYVVINGETRVWCGDVGQAMPGLSIVDPAARVEKAIVETAEGPVWPLVDAQRRKVYVAGSARGVVAVHDPVTGALERSITIGGRPHDLGLDVAGSSLLVSNTFDMSQTYVSVVNVDTGVVLTNLQVPMLPHKVVVDEARRVGYAVSLGAGEITSVDLATGARLGQLSSGPIPQTSAMVFSPATRRLYVGKTGGSTPGSGSTIVAVDVDTGSIVGEVGTFTPGARVPTRPWGGFGLDEASQLLYAAVANSNDVVVIDLATMKPAGLFAVDACPWAVTLDLQRGVGYVSSNQAAALTTFDLAKVRRAVGR